MTYTDTTIHSDEPVVPNVVPSPDEASHARLAWEVAVDQLVQPGQERIRREDGTEEIAEVLCLLDQVDEAVMPGMENTGGYGGGSKPPASLNALALLAEIATEVRACCRSHDHEAFETIPDQVRAWVAHAADWQHSYPEYVVWAADRAARWVTQARLLLNPPPRFVLRGKACPVCDVDTVLVWSDEESDFVRRPALAIDPDRIEAVCANCGQIWGLEIWAQLAATLDRQLTQDTLAVTGDTSRDGDSRLTPRSPDTHTGRA
ncbi:hypothetical protein JOF56_000851 [Kibdelosporangium banguiense]|uniref:Uncharacterized protein n=1 Tax=Kibdelosporangium banguiense TaxID=1365924 RepID=A0ABS4T824_9PSEU|nr:hypothetical protein [Kibdelosporangium banguiense]MBP2320466.1 hypothetical protein [Kibdelosporangium banguiense]